MNVEKISLDLSGLLAENDELLAENDELRAKVAELEADNEYQMQASHKAVEETNSWITKYNTQLEHKGVCEVCEVEAVKRADALAVQIEQVREILRPTQRHGCRPDELSDRARKAMLILEDRLPAPPKEEPK